MDILFKYRDIAMNFDILEISDYNKHVVLLSMVRSLITLLMHRSHSGTCYVKYANNLEVMMHDYLEARAWKHRYIERTKRTLLLHIGASIELAIYKQHL
jgi:hypothetical protein